MKRVYICCKYKYSCIEVDKQKQFARIYCRIALDKGYFPIATQLYLPQFMDDSRKGEKGRVRSMSLRILGQCDEVWVFGENKDTKMREEIEQAAELNIPITYFDEYGEPL